MKAFSAKVVAALILLASWVTPASLAQTAAAGSDAPPPPPDASAARLIEAVRSGDRPLFAKILGEQPDIVNRRAAGGSTPLIYAALYADANAVAMLLDRGANPNLANEAGATALMCGVGDEQITRQLLDHGADANAASRRGQTPLSIAAGRAGSRRVVGLLLDYGASPSPIPPAGTAQPANPLGTALVQVANAGDEEVFRLLVERGADVKAAGAAGLMLAARANCAACVDMLIGSVAPAALSSALVGLAPIGDTALLTRLIDRGADVNVRLPNVRPDVRNRTPLMLAASSDLVPIDTVKMLIARGADINALGPEGETPLDLARRNGDTAVVDLLQKAGAKPGRGFPTARVTPKPATSARAAIERVMPLLQTSGVAFVQKTGCVSCHHNTLTTMTVAAARDHGLPFDDAIAGNQRKAIASIVERRHDMSLLGAEQSNTANNTLVGLAADDRAPDLVTDAMAHLLKSRQLADGRGEICSSIIGRRSKPVISK